MMMLMLLLIKYIKFYQVFDLQVPQTFFGVLNSNYRVATVTHDVTHTSALQNTDI